MARLFRATWTLPIIFASASLCLAGVDVTYEWRSIDYTWESDDAKLKAIEAGTYDPTKIIINDVQPLPDGRILVTTPRYHNNPAGLSTISTETGDGGPLLQPYPSWSWHGKDDCSGITSVNRVILDDYERLWLVDSGKIENDQVCPAKILVFNIKSNKQLASIEIPYDLAHNPDDESQGRLEISAVETSGDLESDTWVYISDIEGFGFLVWNGTDIWRLNDNVYKPNPEHTTFSIAGENVTLSIGTSSVLILPDGYLEKRTMMFKPMSSILGHAVTLEDLHNSWSPDFKPTYWTTDFISPSQELARTFTKDGILIAGFTTETTIGCWNLANPLVKDYIAFLEVNEVIFQFISGVKNLDGKLYLASNRFQKYMLGTMDFDEVNFRIMTADIATLVKGTVCEPPGEWIVASSIEEKAFSLFDGSS